MRSVRWIQKLQLVCMVVILSLGSASFAEAQVDEIGPLLGSDIVIVGDNDRGEALAGDPYGTPSDIEFDGRQYLVVWTGLGSGGTGSNSDIYGRFIATSGSFNGDYFPIATDRSNSLTAGAVAFNGTNYLVAWIDQGTSIVKGQLISPRGSFIGGEISISPSGSWAVRHTIGVASDGADFLVAWTREDAFSVNSSDVCGQLIKGNGELEGTHFVIGDNSRFELHPSIAFGAGKYLVTYEVHTSYNTFEPEDIFGTIIDASTGNQSPAFPITTAPLLQGAGNYTDQPSVGISFNGMNFMVVWRDSRPDGVGAYGARISPDGELLDGPPDTGGIPIYLDSSFSGNYQSPQVTFDGESWIVVWNQRHRELLGLRINADGVVIDQTPLLLSEDVQSWWKVNTSIASDGTNNLICWSDGNEQHAQLIGTGIPTASADSPFLASVGESIEMDASASFSIDGHPLTYRWDFGDGSTMEVPETIVTHAYTATGKYTVTLVVNDGLADSKPFATYATVVGISGGGQQKNVDNFLTFIEPFEKTTRLPSGTTSYDITVAYGHTINPETLNVVLNGTSFDGFYPVAEELETVTIPLTEGRNTILFMIDGVRPDGHVATDRDRLTFVVK